MDGAPDPNRRLATGAARLPSFHLSADFPAGAASFEPVVLRCRYPVATTVLSRVMKPPAGNEPSAAGDALAHVHPSPFPSMDGIPAACSGEMPRLATVTSCQSSRTSTRNLGASAALKRREQEQHACCEHN
jgi:hypothetical protein